jgi:hypothetical protein
MITLAIVLIYCLVALLVTCRVGTLLAWHWLKEYNRGFTYLKREEPSGDQWVGGLCVGALAGCVWPFLIGIYAARRWLFEPPKDVRMARLEAANRELERQLSLR